MTMPTARFARICVPACLFLFSALALGCGGGGKAGPDGVSGKVTLNGQAVTGEISFIGSDKKELSSPLGKDGSYQIINPAKGEYSVVIRSLGSPAPTTGFKGEKAVADAGTASEGAAPPAKYAKPDNGLKFEVTGGKQEKNFELQ